MLAGMPDLMLLEERHGFKGLFMELKTETGVTSEEQENRIAELTSRGYICYVARSARTAIELIEKYLQE
jgi:hypothetical protein